MSRRSRGLTRRRVEEESKESREMYGRSKKENKAVGHNLDAVSRCLLASAVLFLPFPPLISPVLRVVAVPPSPRHLSPIRSHAVKPTNIRKKLHVSSSSFLLSSLCCLSSPVRPRVLLLVPSRALADRRPQRHSAHRYQAHQPRRLHKRKQENKCSRQKRKR